MKYPTARWLLAFITVLVIGKAFAVETAGRPNVLFILSDDQSTPHLGCLGEKGIRTPNLDRFASQGMLFDKQFCGAPQCVPSRATFLTGRSAVAVRITRFSSPLPGDVPTMADLLRDQGYFAGICRRNFHLDGPEKRGPVTDAAFKKHPELRTFAKRVDFLDINSPREKTVPLVNEFLDKVPNGKPFFLWLNFNEPHHAWNRPAPGGPHDPAKITVPPYLPDIPQVRKDLARYYDEIAAMDEEFQWVMDILQKRHLDTNTVVMFLGDNGYAFPHGKGSLYDPGLNTPLLVRWPGKIKAGTRSSQLISGEDIAPTLLEAAGAPVPKQMTGKSFLKLLVGEPFTGRKYIFAERGPHGQSTFNENTKANSFDQSRCVRSTQFKLIYNCTPNQIYAPVDSGGDPYWKKMVALHEEGKLAPEFDRAYFTHPRPIYELFDLAKDPGELTNLAGKPEYKQIEHELKAALQEKMIVDYDYLPLPLADKGQGKGNAEDVDQ
ncbi:MAG: arylsulfatase family protein [Verrucomicrobiales bacterium]|nr:arylsulfatase family protein [Verrucomicrobiales bacterium]